MHDPLHGGRPDVESSLPFRVTRYYKDLSRDPDPTRDPITAQYLPQDAESLRKSWETEDPIGDNRYMVVERLIHHYRDRALLLVCDRCAVYCRHCFRRHFTSHGGGRITQRQLDAVCAYLSEHPEIKEVLLSGGDPLMLPDRELAEVMRVLRDASPGVVLRLCTRMPVVLPSRLSNATAEMLGSYRPLWTVIHVNHPREVTGDLAAAVERLLRAGVPVMNQAVLLRGINDHADILEELFRGLLRIGVKPYYLFQGDLASGTAHFRVSIERGLALMRELRSRLSGLAVPTYAVDLPGGGGKVPVESALRRIEDEWYVLEGPDGREYRYPRETSR